MQPHEIALASKMLNDYADTLSNNGCNDWSWPPEWTVEQRVQFCRDLHEFSGKPETFDPSHLWMPDFDVADLLAHKLKASLT